MRREKCFPKEFIMMASIYLASWRLQRGTPQSPSGAMGSGHRAHGMAKENECVKKD
jgi:hypothetical protein